MTKITKNYFKCFEKLEEDNVDELITCLHENIIFIDPFNKVKGKENVKKILLLMFKKTVDPQFKVLYSIEDKEKEIVKWKFKCEAIGKSIEFEGLSEIKVKDNLVIYHEDFWDTGRNFYCKIPFLGVIFKKIHK